MYQVGLYPMRNPPSKAFLEFTLKGNRVIAPSKYGLTLICEQTIVAHLTKL
jgi:hypothetical protein